MKRNGKRPIPLSGYIRHIVVALAVACAVVGAASVWRSSARKHNDRAAEEQQFRARVRDGVGREVALPAQGDSAGQIRAAVNSVAVFMERRAGVQLSGATKNRLAGMEARMLSGAARRLTLDELSDIITTTAMERLATLSEQEIAEADDILRGFNAPDMPAGFSRDLKLPGGIVFMGTPPERTIARLRGVRDQLGAPAGEVFQGMARRIVRERARNRAQYLSRAVPERFGNMWDTINDREYSAAEGSVTPLQALLIAYSLASDDYLTDSEAALARRMRGIQATISQVMGSRYPSPAGQRAYGVNGYIFSSPLNLWFDERIITSLLDKIEEGGTV